MALFLGDAAWGHEASEDLAEQFLDSVSKQCAVAEFRGN
jgi:hypothetical protein